MEACPCGSKQAYEHCCGPLIGGAPAPTAEALMRSRYTAFVRADFDYIEQTCAEETRPLFDRAATEANVAGVKWLDLEICETSEGGADDETGIVEFRVLLRKNAEIQVLHERSSFCRENGRWVYLDGDLNPKPKTRTVEKIGRNEPCPCGSGKKYKKCCGA